MASKNNIDGFTIDENSSGQSGPNIHLLPMKIEPLISPVQSSPKRARRVVGQ